MILKATLFDPNNPNSLCLQLFCKGRLQQMKTKLLGGKGPLKRADCVFRDQHNVNLVQCYLLAHKYLLTWSLTQILCEGSFFGKLQMMHAGLVYAALEGQGYLQPLLLMSVESYFSRFSIIRSSKNWLMESYWWTECRCFYISTGFEAFAYANYINTRPN